jgi:hypothetical protein
MSIFSDGWILSKTASEKHMVFKLTWAHPRVLSDVLKETFDEMCTLIIACTVEEKNQVFCCFAIESFNVILERVFNDARKERKVNTDESECD